MELGPSFYSMVLTCTPLNRSSESEVRERDGFQVLVFSYTGCSITTTARGQLHGRRLLMGAGSRA